MKLPSELHLYVLLNFLGSSGNSSTFLRLGKTFGVGSGSIMNMIDRTMTAILELKDTVMMWPDEEERKEISDAIHRSYGFVDCMGLIDGTLFWLEFKPQLNGEEYFTRKGGYTTTALIVCDHLTRIRWIRLGWPGSVHDNQVWTNSELNLDWCKFFSFLK